MSQAKKRAYETSTRFSSCCLSQKPSSSWQANKLKNPLLQNNTGDGILLQALRGGTNLNGIGNELLFFFQKMDLLFVTVGFVYSRWESTVTDGV